MGQIDASLVSELYQRANGARWALPHEAFEAALRRSLEKAMAGADTTAPQAAKYLRSLHLEDLALAGACAAGEASAWDHFVREFRPQLYRAALAIDPTGASRELADELYADLFGMKERDGVRQSLFRYFHGRSSLATWLRSVLSQRHVDRIRTARRTAPLDEEGAQELLDPRPLPAPDRPRHVAVLLAALDTAVSALAPRDRLRLACYHAQELTLAQIGRLTGEHEATVSRHLTRTRRHLRQDIEARLAQQGMAAAEIAECFADATADPGAFDVSTMLGGMARKTAATDRSS